MSYDETMTKLSNLIQMATAMLQEAKSIADEADIPFEFSVSTIKVAATNTWDNSYCVIGEDEWNTTSSPPKEDEWQSSYKCW